MRKFLLLIILSFGFGQDPPVAFDDEYTLDEDTVISIDLNAIDSNEDELTFRINHDPNHGYLTIEGGSGGMGNSFLFISYIPDANFNGYDSFTFIANDGEFDSNEATISLIVNPVNDAPYIYDIPDSQIDTYSTFTYELVAIDVDGDALVFSVSINGNGTATISGNFITIIPDEEYFGEIIVVLTV